MTSRTESPIAGPLPAPSRLIVGIKQYPAPLFAHDLKMPSIRFIPAFAFLVLSHSIVCPGDSPSVESLKAKIPHLSQSNAELNAFRVTLAMPTMLPNLTMTYDWNREGNSGVLVSTDTDFTPPVFVSQGEAFLFDATKPEISLLGGGRPKAKFTRSGQGVGFKYGVTNEDGAEIDLDFRMFFDRANDVTVVPSKGAHLDLMATADDGRSVVARFPGASSRYPQFIEARKQGELVLGAYGFKIDDDIGSDWPDFPSTRDFPGQPKTVRSVDMGQFQEVLQANARLLWQSAISFPAFREHAESVHRQINSSNAIDWDSAERNLRVLGPPLRELVRADAMVAEIPDDVFR